MTGVQTCALPILLASAMFLACNNNRQSGFMINGKLLNSNKQLLFLEQLSPSSVSVIDSVRIDENGEFTFSGHISEAGFFRLRLAKNNFINLLMDSLDTIHVNADARNLYYTYNMEGPKEASILYELNNYLRMFAMKTDSLKRVYGQLQNTKDRFTASLTLNEEYNRFLSEKTGFIKSFIDKNSGSLAALAAIENLNPENDFAYFLKLDEALNGIYPNSKYVRTFHNKVSQLKRLAPGSDRKSVV